MLKKVTLFSFLLLLLAFQSFAAKVTLPDANKVAINFMTERHMAMQGHLNIPVISESFTKFENDAEVYYAYNLNPQGFIVISAEDAFFPVIGFSFDGKFVYENMEPNFASFMQNYIAQILMIRSENIQAESEVSDAWHKYLNLDLGNLTKGSGKNISPLLTSLWNQDYPYNKLCPADGSGPGGHVYAGCVATAMSMVMQYWRYPLQGIGQHSYNYYPYGNISANFGQTEYKFTEMKDVMDPEYNAVALLQFHCGVAVEMMYGPGGSGAYSEDVPGAIQSHFGYSASSEFYDKNSYNISQWTSMLKAQLDLKQPMYYSGCSNSGCHAFVCDGYSDNDYFHFNFGWSGTNNGYYTLNEVGGFNSWQGAVMDFIPASNYPYGCQGQTILTAKSGSIEDGSGPVLNYESGTDCSWLIDPQQPGDSISSITLHFIKFDIGPADYVTIYDGGSATSSILGQFTGSNIPADLTSSGNQLLITLKNNGGITGNGFYASYTSEKPEWCHGLTTLTSVTGTINDGSAQFNYYDHSVCMWKVLPENNVQPLTFWFTSFDTESDNDVVKIFDFQSQALIASFSGTYSNGNLPPPVVVPSGKMFITFSTNSSVNHQGWEGQYIAGTVGLNEGNPDNHKMVVYPNPANHQLHVLIPGIDDQPVDVRMYNISGQEVYTNLQSDFSTFHTINVENIPRGVYYLKAQSAGINYTEKIIIR